MRVRCASLLLALALLGAGCDDDSAAVTPAPGATASTPGATAPRATPQAIEPAPPVEHAYRDIDFVESDQNRDPFRSFAVELRARAPVVAQRMVLMPETAIDDMRLIAIISGIDQPRAMIVDRAGIGYTATRGDFIGKAEVVQGQGADALPVALNWRVERIRDNEVVLAREDPSAPGRAPLTKVIPLHDEGDGSKLERGRSNG